MTLRRAITVPATAANPVPASLTAPFLEAPVAVDVVVLDPEDTVDLAAVVAALVARGVELAAAVPPMGAVDWPLIWA